MKKAASCLALAIFTFAFFLSLFELNVEANSAQRSRRTAVSQSRTQKRATASRSRNGRGKALSRSPSRSRSKRLATSRVSKARRATASRSRRGSARDARASRSDTEIPHERVIEIQNALIREGYLAGPATGNYDEGTKDAMRRFQQDNGFTVTGLPSAPALNKLGLMKKRKSSEQAEPNIQSSKLEHARMGRRISPLPQTPQSTEKHH